MNCVRAAALILLALCLTTAGDARAAQQRLAYALPDADRVQRIADQVYRSLAGSPDTAMYGTSLLFDVFLPPAPDSGNRAGVIFIHGGLVPGTQRVSPKDDLPAYNEWGRLVAAAGFVGITFSHRLTINDNVDVAATDVAELLRAIRGRAAEWRLDPNRLCVAVFSAGGPLSSMFMKQPSDARCIALFYPFLDLEHMAVHTQFRQAHSAERVRDLSPFSPRLALLANGPRVPPLLVARAGRDQIPGINASIERFVQAALWVNAPLDLYLHPTGAHGFDMTATPDVRAAEIIAATIAFFRRHLN